MSISLYDEALVAKLKNWAENTQIHVYSPNNVKQLFQTIADTTNDQPIKLPIICLSRNGGYNITNFNKKPLTYDGLTKDATITMSTQINAIPIQINYQLDIYAKYLEDADAISRDLVFNFINHPTVKIVVPYNNTNLLHNSTVRISNSVDDNSSIPERLVQGQFTRLTMNLNIDDAYLWDIRVRNNVTVGDGTLKIYKDINSQDFVQEELKLN